MSPKAIHFKTNSVIYFQGDISDKIYILKAGKVLLKSVDIETGEEIKEMIATGEFFGVKSGLGKYPRDETALVLQDADCLSFQVPEFEQLVLSNTRIIMKMLKVFSNQLRRIHNKVQNLMTKGEQTDAETGLFSIGDYYYNNRQHRQAMYALQRYLVYYPSGRYASQASMRLQDCEKVASTGGSLPPRPGTGPGAGSAPPPRPAATPAHDPGALLDSLGGGAPAPAAGGSTDAAKMYYEAVALVGQERYADAYKLFQKIVTSNSAPEHTAKSEFEIGRCLVFLNKFDEAIRHFTALIQKYPKHPDLKEALFFIGRSYEGKQDVSWAKSFYNKILSMVSDEDEPIAIKTRKALRALEGAKA